MTARPAPPERQSRATSATSASSNRGTDARRSAWRPRADWWTVVALAATTTLIFTKVWIVVSTRGATTLDVAARAWVVAHQTPMLVRAFTWVTIFGGAGWMLAATLLCAGLLWWRGRRHVAVRCLAVPLVAMSVYEGGKRFYARARPPGLNGMTEAAFSFPSAHATASSAVCATLAYLLWREGFIGRSTAVVVAIAIPLLVGASRLYLDRHWATDVLGGWSAGYLVAAVSAALYNRSAQRGSAPGSPRHSSSLIQ